MPYSITFGSEFRSNLGCGVCHNHGCRATGQSGGKAIPGYCRDADRARSLVQDFEHARDEFLKDIALEPDVAFDYDCLGTVYWRMRQNTPAELNFRKALRLNPRLTSSLFGLAQVFNEQGRYSASLSQLDLALKIDPKNNSLHYLRGRVLLRLNRKQEAQAELATATRLLQSQRETRQKELYGTLPHPELTNVPQ